MGETRLQRAIALSDSGDIKSALEEFAALARESNLASEKAMFALNQAVLYLESGAVDDARRLVTEAYNLSKDNTEMILRVRAYDACVYAAGGHLKKACRKLDAVLNDIRRLDPRTRDAVNDVYRAALLERGIRLSELGRHRESCANLEELYRDGDDSCRVLYYLGIGYFKTGRLAEAQQMLQRGLDSGMPPPFETSALYVLGLIDIDVGAFARARQRFEACLQRGNEQLTPRLHELLSEVCSKIGESGGLPGQR